MKTLSKIYTLISILFLLWFAISTIEVSIKHVKPNPQYSSANCWIVFMNWTQQ